MSKKLDAKKLMLQRMSKDLRDSSNKSIGEELKAKKKSFAPKEEEPKEKAISKAEMLIKAKFGEKGLDEEEMEEDESSDSDDFHDDEEEEDCPVCDNEGCKHCEEEAEEIEE